MPRSKRSILAAAEEGSTPPATLPPHQSVARILKPAGSNLYTATLPPSSSQACSVAPLSATDTSDPLPTAAIHERKEILVEMPARFRNTIFVKRGSFVLVDTAAFEGRENRLGGEIVCVVRNEREWMKMGWWPEVWRKSKEAVVDSDEEGMVGRMRESDDEEVDDREERERDEEWLRAGLTRGSNLLRPEHENECTSQKL